MNNVTLKMTDIINNSQVTRTICATNAMTSSYPCYELGSEEEQRVALQDWINERGNAQHETILQLDSWTFC